MIINKIQLKNSMETFSNISVIIEKILLNLSTNFSVILITKKIFHCLGGHQQTKHTVIIIRVILVYSGTPPKIPDKLNERDETGQTFLASCLPSCL